MTDKQIEFLKQFRKEGIAAIDKTTHSDLRKLITELKSLKIIAKKQTSPTLEIIDLNSFEKLIELKSLIKFKKWYSKKDKKTRFEKVIYPLAIGIFLVVLAMFLGTDRIMCFINELINEI